VRGSRLVPNVAWLKGVRPIVWPEGPGGGTETFLPGFFEDIAMTFRILLILIALALAVGAYPASAAQFRPLLADTSRDTDPAPSPDGKWLAYQSNKGGSSQVWILPAGGGAPRKLTSEPATTKAPDGKAIPTRVMTPTWAPDSKSLLYISTRSGGYNIYSIPLAGGTPKALSNAAGAQRYPVYSPDGTKIVFPSSRNQPGSLWGFQLYLMDAKGEVNGPPARQLTRSNGSPGHPIWSPDGKWVCYVAKDFDSTRTVNIGGGMQAKQSAMFSSFRVYKIPATGGREVKLTGIRTDPGQAEDTWPAWSPDGKWIAFGRNIQGKSNLWLLDVLSGHAFPITELGNAMKPNWSPDGKSLYFTRLDEKQNEDIWVATNLDLVSNARAKR
jgi:Tol biopolymer transport system component